tara:strand:- start:71009 stop:71392 length:384 start_codon:yes stop_codon:yes gene_type:complete
MKRFSILTGLAVLAIAVSAMALPRVVVAAELVMFESESCTWCQRWHDEIGTIYPKTSDARCAPLRRVDIGEARPDDLSDIKGIVYTPTFVLVDAGREVARLVGYPGEDFFWPILADHLAKLPNGCPK